MESPTTRAQRKVATAPNRSGRTVVKSMIRLAGGVAVTLAITVAGGPGAAVTSADPGSSRSSSDQSRDGGRGERKDPQGHQRGSRDGAGNGSDRRVRDRNDARDAGRPGGGHSPTNGGDQSTDVTTSPSTSNVAALETSTASRGAVIEPVAPPRRAAGPHQLRRQRRTWRLRARARRGVRAPGHGAAGDRRQWAVTRTADNTTRRLARSDSWRTGGSPDGHRPSRSAGGVVGDAASAVAGGGTGALAAGRDAGGIALGVGAAGLAGGRPVRHRRVAAGTDRRGVAGPPPSARGEGSQPTRQSLGAPRACADPCEGSCPRRTWESPR